MQSFGGLPAVSPPAMVHDVHRARIIATHLTMSITAELSVPVRSQAA